MYVNKPEVVFTLRECSYVCFYANANANANAKIKSKRVNAKAITKTQSRL